MCEVQGRIGGTRDLRALSAVAATTGPSLNHQITITALISLTISAADGSVFERPYAVVKAAKLIPLLMHVARGCVGRRVIQAGKGNGHSRYG